MDNTYSKLEALLKSSKFKKALPLIIKAKKKSDADNKKLLSWEAICLSQTNQKKRAMLLWPKVVESTEDIRAKEAVYTNYYNDAKATGEVDIAIQCLKALVDLTSGSAGAKWLAELCKALFEVRRYSDIEEYAKKLAIFNEHFQYATYLLCESAAYTGSKELSLIRLDKLAAHYESLSESTIGYATLRYCDLNEFNRAGELLTKTSSKFENEEWHKVSVAVLSYHTRKYEDAKLLFLQCDVQALPNWYDKGLYYDLLGRTYEKLNDFTNSFINIGKAAQHSENKYGNVKVVDIVPRYNKLSDFRVLLDNYQDTNNEVRIAFMFGFPRTGTTLLENVLDVHPEILSLSEPDTLSSVMRELVKDYGEKNYPNCLTSLTSEDLVRYREIYFNKVKEIGQEDIEGRFILDKMPTYSIHIPLIIALFPDAKMIVNLRHPLDVVLSCFQQRFSFNNENSFLTTLPKCVSRYKQVTDLMLKTIDELSLDVHTIKYEGLVDNMKDEIARLLNYLKLSNNHDFERFYDNANSKVVNTSSKNQVNQPLYSTSVYKYRNYKKQMKEHVEELRLLIEKLGYDI